MYLMEDLIYNLVLKLYNSTINRQKKIIKYGQNISTVDKREILMTNKHMKTVQYCLLGKCLLKLQKDIYTPDQNNSNEMNDLTKFGENIKHL